MEVTARPSQYAYEPTEQEIVLADSLFSKLVSFHFEKPVAAVFDRWPTCR
jgi:hypothetical protein